MYDHSVIILTDRDGHPAFLEFRHGMAPSFRALMVFASPDDARRWLDEQPEAAKPAWDGYEPVVLLDLETIARQFRASYGQSMAIINISQIMRPALAVQ